MKKIFVVRAVVSGPTPNIGCAGYLDRQEQPLQAHVHPEVQSHSTWGRSTTPTAVSRWPASD